MYSNRPTFKQQVISALIPTIASYYLQMTPSKDIYALRLLYYNEVKPLNYLSSRSVCRIQYWNSSDNALFHRTLLKHVCEVLLK